ncbi:MAG: UDP-N-acetylmuramate dehydrogenase [Fusobacteria bacterium]|nr:MAG: UDP-N-acetylmuramate dehydrogenase [Fusobacteriota bacterium]KAF0229939.1 MAG: UDP-N-acetylmuramate [Fusobacteriota bacterium]
MDNKLFNITKVYKGEIAFNYDIKKLMSWKIGGLVECIAFPKSEQEIIELKEYVEKHEIPYYIIGKGSNILFGNQIFQGLIIYLGKNYTSYNIEEVTGGFKITCSSGLTLAKLGNIAKEEMLSGCEYLSYIPGSIGGAILTNAEAHKQAIGNITTKVKVLDNNRIVEYTKEMCDFKYRSSIFENKSNIVILSIEVYLIKTSKEEISLKMKEAKDYRLSKQPNKPSAGSVFKNHSLGPAGKLIEDAGLKGLKVGDAKISELHGNFITNENMATSEDVIYLIETIRQKIKDKFDIDIELEIKLFNL